MPWFTQLVTGLSPWQSRFIPSPDHVGFVVDKLVALTSGFSPSTLVFPRLHTHSFVYN